MSHLRALAEALLIAGLLLLSSAGLRSMRRNYLLAVVLLAGLVALSGCGGNGFNGQAVADYGVTVTATSGQVAHSFEVNLNLQ